MNDDKCKTYYEEQDKRIIEKYIDFKDYYNKKQKNKMLSSHSFTNMTPRYKPKKSILKYKNNLNNLNIENNQNHSLRTSYSSNHVITTANYLNDINTNLNSSITPKIVPSYYKTIQVENPKNRKTIGDLILNSKKTIQGNRFSNKSISMGNNYGLCKDMNYKDLSEIKNNSVFHKDNNNSSEKNFSLKLKQIYNSKKNNIIEEVDKKGKEAKTYIHKKLIDVNNSKNNNE